MYVTWELGYDSVVFLLTIARTLYMHWRHQGVASAEDPKHSLIGKLVRDGAFYFGCVPLFCIRTRLICISCIFSMNLMWVIMILYAPTGLRGIAAMYVPTPPLVALTDVSFIKSFFLVS